MVVTIVGVLATLAIPTYGRMVERAKVRDAQTVLVSIFNAQRMYRLDQTAGTPPVPTYGTLPNLINNRYLTDPDPGPPPGTNRDWNFDTPVVTANTFTARARRIGGDFDQKIIFLDQTYTGAPNYGGRVYGGDHILRD